MCFFAFHSNALRLAVGKSVSGMFRWMETQEKLKFAWECLRISQEELVSVTGDRAVVSRVTFSAYCHRFPGERGFYFPVGVSKQSDVKFLEQRKTMFINKNIYL